MTAIPLSEIARDRDEVVKTHPDRTVRELAANMDETDIGSVIVVEDDRPVGIVTDRDVATRVTAQGRDPESTTVREIMSDDLVTVESDDSIEELIRSLGEAGVRRMPVVEDGEIAGIVTLDDIVVLIGSEIGSIATELDSVTSVIRSESPPY